MKKEIVKPIIELLILIAIFLFLVSRYPQLTKKNEAFSYEAKEISGDSLGFCYDSNRIRPICNEIKQLLSGKHTKYRQIEKNDVAEKYDISKIATNELNKQLDEVEIKSQSRVISSLTDERLGETYPKPTGYVWLEYEYIILDRKTNTELKKKKGIDRIFFETHDSDGYVTLLSSVEIPNMDQPFWKIEEDGYKE